MLSQNEIGRGHSARRKLIRSLGIVSVPIRKGGLWLIRTIHVVEANRGAWETHWASLVFQAGR